MIGYQRLSPKICAGPRLHIARFEKVMARYPDGVVIVSQWSPANELGPPEKKGVVRVKICEGNWLLEPDGAAKTLATYSIYTDSGGFVPAFIANRVSLTGITKIVRGCPQAGKGSKIRGGFAGGHRRAARPLAKSFSRITRASIVSPHESEFFPVSSRITAAALYAQRRHFGRERARHSKETCFHRIPWSNRGRSVSVARRGRRLAGESVVGRAESADTQISRQIAGSGGDRKTITEWYAKTSPSYSSLVSRPGILFAMKFQPPKQQPLLVTLASADDLKSEKVVLDPNVLDTKGTTAIDWFVPSLDGKYVAMSLSKGGSEDGTLHFYETATGKALPDTIAHVQYPTAGGSAAWNADGTGIYYTRFPRKGERPEADLNFYQQVYFHKLGTPDTEDTYSIGKDFPRIAEIDLEASRDGKYILATVANGDGGDFAHYLLGPDGTWKQITQFSDQIKLARLGRDNALYLLSRAGAPRGKILRLPLDVPELKNAAEIVASGRSGDRADRAEHRCALCCRFAWRTIANPALRSERQE